MAEKTVTVQLPESTFRKLSKAAELTHRTVDDLLDTTVNAALAAPTDLPQELSDELAAMNLLSDEALKAAAEPSLSAADQQRLSQLNEKAAVETLTPAEVKEQADLLAAFHRSVLRRAQALAILAQRGHILSENK